MKVEQTGGTVRIVLEEEHLRALGLAGTQGVRIVNGGLECRVVVGEVVDRPA